MNREAPRGNSLLNHKPASGKLIPLDYAGDSGKSLRSFSIVLSSALVCSTSPPVSVSGTVYVGAISWNPFAAPGIQ